MEALFVFIAKSSGLLVLFYFAYMLLLRKETFFNSNRWFLLLGLITSVILPFIVYTKIIWVDPVPMPTVNYSSAYIPHTIVEEENFEINWNFVSIAIYAIGFTAFLLKFAIDFYSLNTVLKGKKIEQQEDFKFIDINENIAPFSYFDYIVYNSSMYSAAELENIIEHEKVHSDQHHTVDVLISRIFCILFWFNPIMWFYKKAIVQNLEFIADSEAAKKISDKKAYQYTLLKITTHENCVSITNHFYQSLIKKRIVMLNKNQSKKSNYWKYCAVLPVLVVFVLLFQIKTIAQEKKENLEIAEKKDSVDVIKIKKTTTDQELKQIAENLKNNYDAEAVISDVKRNSKNELTCIKMNINIGDEETQTIEINGDEAIKSFGIVVTTDNDGAKKIGILSNGAIEDPVAIRNHVAQIKAVSYTDTEIPPTPPTAPTSIIPPTPPTPPTFPAGAMPQVPAVDMTKMPKPPVAPKNHNDKVAMAKFEKEMDEFEKKMEAYEPDMTAYEKQVDEIMAQREAIYEKEMQKYDIAMEKFNSDMEKFNFNMDFNFDKNMKQYELNMKQYELNMKQFEKNMKQNEINMKQMEKNEKKS